MLKNLIQKTHYIYGLLPATMLYSLLVTDTVLGQIVPDATLPVNSTVIRDGNSFNINGGTQADSNLFHSFIRFDIPNGTEAFFNNPDSVGNIFARVTGSSASNIDGILKANGNTNLFLMNPNGIIFGANANLKIGGSFFGTTADSIKFTDGREFSTTARQEKSILSINVPVGLQFGNNNLGKITVNGAGHSLTAADPTLAPVVNRDTTSGLRVQPGKTLALLGGEITLNGGLLTAPNGRLELGSIGASSLVSLKETDGKLAIDYNGTDNFQNIHLSQRTLVDVSGENAGSIQIRGHQISLTDASVALAQNFGTQKSGNINVTATELLLLSGSDGIIRSGIGSETLGLGISGNINVSAQELIIQDGAVITNKTFSPADGGSVNVNASKKVVLDGFMLTNPIPMGIGTIASSSGKSGNINISTPELIATRGASIGSTNFGSTSSGNVTINSSSIKIIGANATYISSISASNLGSGNAGSVNINTDSLIVHDGGSISTSSLSMGNAGSITINANKFVEVTGEKAGLNSAISSSAISSSIDIPNELFQILFKLPAEPSGASGNITINTPSLKIANSGNISVQNDGKGNAGMLNIYADLLLLDKQGSIKAASNSGVGGNIDVELKNMQLRNNSTITTTARGIGRGGNISITTDTLAALENSDITANSIDSNGGRVIINAQGIFGTQFRPQLTPKSDITATSALGAKFNGVVQVNSPDVDTSTTTYELPSQVTNPSELITRRCATVAGDNNFIVAGNGGLPQSPTAPLISTRTWLDFRPVSQEVMRNRQSEIDKTTYNQPPLYSKPQTMVEATGWLVDNKGKVQLVAETPSVSLNQPWETINKCNGM